MMKSGRKKRGRAAYTKEERADRWDTCIRYLRVHESMPAAQRAAAADDITFPTAVWITALSKLLERGGRPGDLKKRNA